MQEKKGTKEKVMIFDPFQHIENIADLTVENLKEQLLREEIDIEATSELTVMQNELKTFYEVTPLTKAKEIKTKPDVKIEVQDSNNVFQTPNFEQQVKMQTKGQNNGLKAVKKNEKQISSFHESTTYANTDTNNESEYLRQEGLSHLSNSYLNISFISGPLGGQPSKEDKLTLQGRETRKRPSGVFLWLLLVFALLVLYLVVHMGFKEGDMVTSQVSRPIPIKDERAKGIVKEVISENLYEYFDVKKWP